MDTSVVTQNVKPHLLGVMLEDYFHVGNMSRVVQRAQWYRFQTRFEQNTLKTLDLLDRFQIKTTFFVLGWIAEQQPELVREVARRGHEIAARGLYLPRRSRPMTAAEFRVDVGRTRDILEATCETPVVGFRAARHWSAPSDLWALDVLAEEGFRYDTSVLPVKHISRREPWRRVAHQHEFGGRDLWEFPVSTFGLDGMNFPIAGGNYFRQLPHTLLKHVVEHWMRTHTAPFTMYFHIWELDREQPQISALSKLKHLRHYRKLDKIEWVVEEYFRRYNFTGFNEYLTRHHQAEECAPASALTDSRPAKRELPTRVSARNLTKSERIDDGATTLSHRARTPVSIVIPCFNEELALLYLANTLRRLAQSLSELYEVRFIFVDDASTDGTWRVLHEVFGAESNCTLLQHTENGGVTRAIRTGIMHAETEIVCSMDCDCTYDPHELRHMLPLLGGEVAMVTASPYHPLGRVRNVPGWRLTLSRGSSFLYRRVLRQKLYTYTSCFRVYRRSVIADLEIKENGFLGVAEMLGRLDLQGSVIVEHPATLEVRLFGRSKMKTLRTIGGHLGLLTQLLILRIRQNQTRRALASQNELACEQTSSPLNLISTSSTPSAVAHIERT